MKKSEKVFLVEDLTARIKAAKSLLFVNMTGINVGQQEELRKTLRSAGGKLMVVKNTLLGLAAGQAVGDKQKAASIREQLTGPTAIILSTEDEIAPLQVLGKFIKSFDVPKLKFGYVAGNVYNTETLLRLSRLPGRELLQRQVVGTLAGPLYGLIETLKGNFRKLVYILEQRKGQSEGR